MLLCTVSIVATPEQAISLLQKVAVDVIEGREPCIAAAVKKLKKDRKTLIRFRHIYYLKHTDADLLQEVGHICSHL